MKVNLLLSGVLVVSMLASCDSDSGNDTPKPTDVEQNVVIVTGIPNPDGYSGACFFDFVADLSAKSLQNKDASQFPFNAPVNVIGNTLFVPPLMSNIEDLRKYEKSDEGKFKLTGELAMPAGSHACNVVKLNDEKAYVALMSRPEIIVFNPTKMEELSRINISAYAYSDNDPNASCMVIRDGLLYVSLDQMKAGSFTYEERPISDVLIIDTKNDQVVKKIEEKTSGISMAGRPLDPKSLFVDENNDLYAIGMGNFGMGKGHKTGVLRIKNGETEFDADYSIAAQDIAIEGIEHRGDWLVYVQYAGNGKLYGLLHFNEYMNKEKPNFLVDKSVVPVMINLEAKSILKLDLPRSNCNCSVGIYKNTILFGLSTDKDTGIYTCEIGTNTCSQSAVIKTQGDPYAVKAFNQPY